MAAQYNLRDPVALVLLDGLRIHLVDLLPRHEFLLQGPVGLHDQLAPLGLALSQGDVYISPTMTKKLLSDYLRRAKTGKDKEVYTGLTGREKEILKLVAEGRNNQDIAEKLFLSPSTVQTHRANIMAKLGLHSRTELVKYAILHGLIVLDP
jgi:two-component system response regulator NreC